MINSINKEIQEELLEEISKELEARPEMLCSVAACVVEYDRPSMFGF